MASMLRVYYSLCMQRFTWDLIEGNGIQRYYLSAYGRDSIASIANTGVTFVKNERNSCEMEMWRMIGCEGRRQRTYR